MENDKKPLNSESLPGQGGVNWKPGIELFSQVSVWIVVPIVLALIVGKALDNYFNTKPVLFFICIGLAFLFTCIGMVRVVRKYIKNLKDIEENTKK